MKWQIVDCQNSQDTELFGQNSVAIFSCVVRGLKIVLSPTLSGVQIHHSGTYVCLCGADSPHQWQQVLVDVGDRQGLPMQCPPPHSHNEGDRVHQSALVKIEQLVYHMHDFQMGDLHSGKWRCKFLQMVLQYQRLCLSSRVAKSVHFVFKFCLYKIYSVLTYFRKFPVCIWLFVHQNSRDMELYLRYAGSRDAPLNANEAEIEARSLQVPGCNQRGKMLWRSLERWSRAGFQCRIPEVTSLVVMDMKSCVKTCKYFRKL